MIESTPHQREEVTRLLRKLHLDAKWLTFQHRRIGAPEAMIQAGGEVENWLNAMDMDQTSALIDKLRGML